MKIVFILSIVALSAMDAVFQQKPTNRVVRMSAGEDSRHAKVKLTTSIASEQVCIDGRMRFLLLFKFTNIGEQTVIVDRFRPVVSRYMVSSSEKAASAQRYEVSAHRLIGLKNQILNTETTLDESRLISLNRGASYEVTDEFSFSTKNDDGKPLRPGIHVLQVIVSTWNHPGESNIEWREKLREKGYLWSDSVLSDPMPLPIPKRASGDGCL